jgi:dihydroorotase
MEPKWTNASALWLKGARLVDPGAKLDEIGDILLMDGKIASIGKVDISEFSGKTVDVSGTIIMPGLFDMHAHFREPGREDAETIETGCNAAIIGGFTGVAIMPNTTPAMDNVGIVRWVEKRAQGLPVDVCPIAAITKGREGKELTEIAELHSIGVRAFSDDGSPVTSSMMMRLALEYSSMFGVTIIGHEEDMSLAKGGVIHEGSISTALGLRGIPGISDDIMVARDLILLEFVGGKFHVAHVSTAQSLEFIRQAKAKGLAVTVEVTPHHISMTHEAVRSFHTFTKMNPPLRPERDRIALLEGLKDGTIDVIATDHAPHSWEDKEREFDQAPFGIIGLGTAVSVINTFAVEQGYLEWSDVVQRMAINPRRIMQQPEAALKKGESANLACFDPRKSWTVSADDLGSKSKNSPYIGKTLKGRVLGVVRHRKTTIRIEG